MALRITKGPNSGSLASAQPIRSAAPPATAGVEKEVPEANPVAFCGNRDRLKTPVAVISGLARPSAKGPRPLKSAGLISSSGYMAWPWPGPKKTSQNMRVCTGSLDAPAVKALKAVPGVDTETGAGPSLPAATTTRIPASVAASTSRSSRVRPSNRAEPPRLMLITSMSRPPGNPAVCSFFLVITWSTAASMIEDETPEPVWGNTFTA